MASKAPIRVIRVHLRVGVRELVGPHLAHETTARLRNGSSVVRTSLLNVAFSKTGEAVAMVKVALLHVAVLIALPVIEPS